MAGISHTLLAALLIEDPRAEAIVQTVKLHYEGIQKSEAELETAPGK